MKKLFKKITGGILVMLALMAVGGSIAFAHDDGTSHEHPIEDAPASYNPADRVSGSVGSPSSSSSAPAENSTSLSLSPESAKTIVNGATFLLWIERFLNRMLWPLLFLIGGLMDNSLLFEGGMEEQLRAIWEPIRNIVNILFVVALVGVALYNVLGLGEENSEYSIKTILPKVIIAIIAINFSFTGIKVVLDGVAVLTDSVFAIPGQVAQGLDNVIVPGNPESEEIEKRFCAQLAGYKINDLKSIDSAVLNQQMDLAITRTVAAEYLSGVNIRDKSQADILTLIDSRNKRAEFDEKYKAYHDGKICNGARLSDSGEQFLKRFSSRNAALAMAINMGNIVFYEDIPINEFKDIEKVAINALFSVIMYLVYAASFIALFIILLTRLIILWLSIALSPIILLLMVGPQGIKEKLGDMGKISEQFTKMAIAPLIVAGSMSLGWIMLKAIQGLNGLGQASTLGGQALANGLPVVGLSTLQDVIVALATIGVVWVGVFSAASGTIAEKAVGFIKDSMETAAKWVGSIPLKHISAIPVKLPGEEDTHHATVSQIGHAIRAMQNKSDEHDNDLARKLFGEENLPTSARDIAGAATADDLYSKLRNMDPKAMAGDGIPYLKKWKIDHDSQYRTIKEDLRKNLDKLMTGSEDESEKIELAKKIKDQLPLSAGTPPASGTAPGTPPAGGGTTPGGTPPATHVQFTANETIGGGKVTAEAEIQTLNTHLATINDRIQTYISGEGRVKTDARQQILANIGSLSVGDKKITPDELKKYIDYNALDEEIREQIKTELESS
ncbi:hypothetical protein HYW82_00165 [Candidatus Peregrinibacteria bacterium]|nr:hypothetical protein [Candidatus Peregrinibacteria bacterium]